MRAAAMAMGFAAYTASAAIVFCDGASAKTPGKTYCFSGVCHRVLTLAETRAQVGRVRSVLASYYNDCRADRFNPCGLTASGALFEAHKADNAASPIYPNGTKLLVFNPSNGRGAVVRINNAGPYKGRRTLDVSRGAAEKLGFRHRGVARLSVKVIHAPTTAEARYQARRRYAPVQGYIGRFASMSAAEAAAGLQTPGAVVAMALPEPRPEAVERPKPVPQPAAVARAEAPSLALAGASDDGGAGGMAQAAVALPEPLAQPPAPLPVKPSRVFASQIAKLAAANRAAEQRRLVALARERREHERQLALAEERADETARKVAARKRLAAQASAPASKAAAAAGKAEPGRSATRVAQAAPDIDAPAARADDRSQGEAVTPAKPRGTWRREVLWIAENSS